MEQLAKGLRINRIRLEFKARSHMVFQDAEMGINRIRLEFKV